jgi:hypothetical protein
MVSSLKNSNLRISQLVAKTNGSAVLKTLNTCYNLISYFNHIDEETRILIEKVLKAGL